MKRLLCSLLIVLGWVSISAAQTIIIDADFTSPDYSNGDLAGQQGWVAMPNTGIKAFSIDATAGVADTEPFAADFDATDGNYVYLNSSLGNLVDDEWSGVLDFSLSTTADAGTNVASLISQKIYEIGFTANPINGLLPSDIDDIVLLIRCDDTGELLVTLSKSGNGRNLAVLSGADIGWDPLNASAPDLATEPLRLTWTLRKTRVADTYSATAVLSNLTTGAFSVYNDADNDNYVAVVDLYAAASIQLGMGHDSNADEDGTASLINIAIDSLSVDQASGNPPVLNASTLSASGGNALVDLSWTASFEATTYTVKRGLAQGGPYGTTVLTTNAPGSYTDTGLVNDTTYYYIVTTSSAGAADVDSNEAVGDPQGVATGSILSTTFIEGEGYVNNVDLAGQDRWKSATATGAEAFKGIDAAGDGFADTAAYSNSFDTTIGNAVYYNRLMSNNVADEWSGSISFRLSTTATGLWGTNVVETTTNIVNIAEIGNRKSVLQWGINGTPDDDFASPDSVRLDLHSMDGGGLRLGFNGTANAATIIRVDHDEIGWDPEFLTTSTNVADFETELITIDWNIRKSTDADTYMATANLTVGINTISGGLEVNTLLGAPHAANLVSFGMSHPGTADDGDLGPNNGIQVSVDALSLVHSNVPSALIPPSGVGATSEAGATPSVLVTWNPASEASSYTLSRSATNGGPYELITSGLVNGDSPYADSTGLSFGTTYFYIVTAVFDGVGSTNSAQVLVRPLAQVDVVKWGLGTETVPGTDYQSYTFSTSSSNGVNTMVGTPTIITSPSINTSVAPPLYGVLQYVTSNRAPRLRCYSATPSDYLYLLGLDTAQLSALIYAKAEDFQGGTFNPIDQPYLYELTLKDNINGAKFLQGAGIHAAVKLGGQWYVGESSLNVGDQGKTLVVADLSLEKWTPFVEALPGAAEMMTVTNASYATLGSWGNVEAVGFFADTFYRTLVEGFKVFTGTQLTAMEMWADSEGIYNADAGADADPDGDGVNNLYEWGLAGDPKNPSNKGQQPKTVGLDGTGTNFVYVYPRLKDADSRPTYTVEEGGNLVYTNWSDQSASYPVETVGLWNAELESVTNMIPTDLDVKFIKLRITE